MRAKILILGLIGLLLMGVGAIALPSVLHRVFLAPSSFLSSERGFTKGEAEAKMGRRVRVLNCSSLKTIGKRRDDPEGMWMNLTVGESGTVKRMEEVTPHEYHLIVFWDEPKEEYPYRSYYRKAGHFSVYSECLAEE